MLTTAVLLGVILVVFGVLLVAYGSVVCSKTRGMMYNAEDVDAMVAATVADEQEKEKETRALFEDYVPGQNSVVKKGVIMA